MAYKKRVPKTKSYTKFICSQCQNPVDFQATSCPSCKADLSKMPIKTLGMNLIFIAIFAAFAYIMMQ